MPCFELPLVLQLNEVTLQSTVKVHVGRLGSYRTYCDTIMQDRNAKVVAQRKTVAPIQHNPLVWASTKKCCVSNQTAIHDMQPIQEQSCDVVRLAQANFDDLQDWDLEAGVLELRLVRARGGEATRTISRDTCGLHHKEMQNRDTEARQSMTRQANETLSLSRDREDMFSAASAVQSSLADL